MKITPKKNIGIIGGAGKTGSQFARLFRKLGCRVSVTNTKTKGGNARLFDLCDIIIFSVPLARSVAIIEEEIAHAKRADQLLLDLSSLKEKQVNAMLKGKGEVIGMHPLFGPSTDPKNQTIVLCPGRCADETLASLEKILQRMGLRTVVKKPLAHDQLMALLQVLPHVKSFLMADVLRKIDGNVIDTIDATATPAYRIELNLVGRFLDDSPYLYGPIILENPETMHILSLLQESLGEIMHMAEKNHLEEFSEKYEYLKAFFGRHTKEGRERSEECIRTLSTLKRKKSSNH